MQTIINSALVAKAKEALRKIGNKGTVRKKLQAIISAHSHGIKKVSEVMNVSRTSIYL